MTKEALAAQLSGCSIGNEITREQERHAKEDRLLVIFGASDDLCELRGLVHDEVGAYQGATVALSRKGILLAEIDEDDAAVLARHGALEIVKANQGGAIQVKALWCAEKDGPDWTFATDEPHATFDVMEDGEVYCRGIVIQL